MEDVEKVFDSLDKYYFGGNVLEITISTVTIFLGVLLIAKFSTKFTKLNLSIDYNFLIIIILSNGLNAHTILNFIFIIYKIILHGPGFQFLQVTIGLSFLIALLSPLFTYFSLKKERHFNTKIFPIFFLGFLSMPVSTP